MNGASHVQYYAKLAALSNPSVRFILNLKFEYGVRSFIEHCVLAFTCSLIGLWVHLW